MKGRKKEKRRKKEKDGKKEIEKSEYKFISQTF